MWYELNVNPCRVISEPCLIPLGVTSLGGSLHRAKCPLHNSTLTTAEIRPWLGMLFDAFIQLADLELKCIKEGCVCYIAE